MRQHHFLFTLLPTEFCFISYIRHVIRATLTQIRLAQPAPTSGDDFLWAIANSLFFFSSQRRSSAEPHHKNQISFGRLSPSCLRLRSVSYIYTVLLRYHRFISIPEKSANVKNLCEQPECARTLSSCSTTLRMRRRGTSSRPSSFRSV